VLEQLDAVTGAELAYVDRVRSAIFQTLAEIDASLGVKSFWVERLDDEKQDSFQMVGVWYVKKVAALHQGNWEEAEKYRQQAELLTLQSESHSMFSTLGQELEAHAMAGDLTGLKQVRAGIHAMAERHPGWVPVKHVSDAHYLRLCGDLEGALAAARAGFAVGATSSVRSPWAVQARTVESELLTELGHAEEALSLGNEALSECDATSYLARGLSHAVALAEAKLGRFELSNSRIRSLIAVQIALGVTGLQLGRSYELAARIAILASDTSSFREYSALTGEHYHPGQSSVLGALYERLMEDARRALSLLCDGDPPSRGHLFFITETGLELVASSVPDDDISEVTAYAQGRVDLEIAESSALTAMVAPGGEGAQPDDGPWQSLRGTRYDTALLATPLNDGIRVAGIAVLTDDGGRRTHGFGRLTAAVARTVLESGDALGVGVE
jgi:tetratricopeptide (TPR) repeat protein